MSLTFVSEQLLATNKLSHQDLYKVLGQLAERRIDYADLISSPAITKPG